MCVEPVCMCGCVWEITGYQAGVLDLGAACHRSISTAIDEVGALTIAMLQPLRSINWYVDTFLYAGIRITTNSINMHRVAIYLPIDLWNPHGKEYSVI